MYLRRSAGRQKASTYGVRSCLKPARGPKDWLHQQKSGEAQCNSDWFPPNKRA
jgi:hypothetical protein